MTGVKAINVICHQDKLLNTVGEEEEFTVKR